eukprot:6403450-Amphidinium_carterae.1
MSGCPFRGLPCGTSGYYQLKECQPRLVSDCKGVVACLLRALRAGRMWIKTHQSDKDAQEDRVQHSDLQGNHMADVAANNGACEYVPFEPSNEWKHWGTICQAVRSFRPLLGPKLRTHPEHLPTGSGFRPLNLSPIWLFRSNSCRSVCGRAASTGTYAI